MADNALELLELNAWNNGNSPLGDLTTGRRGWGLVNRTNGAPEQVKLLRAPVIADLRDWRHPEVGWGLILPDDDSIDNVTKAAAADAPEPLQALLADRGSVNLRYRPDLNDGFLRRYYADGTCGDISVAASKRGTARNQIPRYLLIYGSPAVIPWSTQFILNLIAYTGRLWLEGSALETYVNCLLNDWAGSVSKPNAPLIWSVNHGAPDISWLMNGALAEPLWKKYSEDKDRSGRRYHTGADATQEILSNSLAEANPGLIVTTSHGATPVATPERLKLDLGLLVDANYNLVRPEQVLNAWQPDGAIWYAHACCSAGSEATTRYDTLFGADDGAGDLLRKVSAGAGAMISPLPQALLGAQKPLKAFIGHVEPTFNWTLRNPDNNQILTSALCDALYVQLYQPTTATQPRTPIGYALHAAYQEAGQFFALWQEALARVNAGDVSQVKIALYRQLVAMDRQNRVILGDPAVALGPFD